MTAKGRRSAAAAPLGLLSKPGLGRRCGVLVLLSLPVPPQVGGKAAACAAAPPASAVWLALAACAARIARSRSPSSTSYLKQRPLNGGRECEGYGTNTRGAPVPSPYMSNERCTVSVCCAAMAACCGSGESAENKAATSGRPRPVLFSSAAPAHRCRSAAGSDRRAARDDTTQADARK
jgi:hypothetical protein